MTSGFTRCQSAIDIKVTRAKAAFNRLDPAYLAEWRKDFATARADYIRGHIHRIDFSDCLQALGYRSDALKAELLDAERDKNDPTYKPPAAMFRYQVQS